MKYIKYILLSLLLCTPIRAQVLQSSDSVDSTAVLATLNIYNMNGKVVWVEANNTPYQFDSLATAGSNDIAGTSPQGGAWVRMLNPNVGIDEVLSQGQNLTAFRQIEADGNGLTISDGTSTAAFLVDQFSSVTVEGTTTAILRQSSTGSNITITDDVNLTTNTAGALQLPAGADPDTDVNTPTNGLIKYDSTDDDIRAYVGGVWLSLINTGATDNDAIHDNVANEITAITEEVSPASTDVLLIEKSGTGEKRKVQITNLPAGNVPDMPFIDVKEDHAAVGDGVADDTTEIQAAIDAAGVSGGWVVFPPGTYLSGNLTIPSNVRISGASKEGVILQHLDTASGSFITIQNKSNVLIENLTIKGEDGDADTAVEIDGCRDIWMKNVRINFFRSPDFDIQGINNEPDAQVTSNGHGLSNGDYVTIYSVVGMTELNNRRFIVQNATTNTFELQGEDTTSYGTYSAGSGKTHAHVGRGLYLHNGVGQNCADNKFYIDIDNTDIAVVTDSLDGNRASGYNTFYSPNIGMECEGFRFIDTQNNGGINSVIMHANMQGSISSSVAFHIEGSNNHIIHPIYDNNGGIVEITGDNNNFDYPLNFDFQVVTGQNCYIKQSFSGIPASKTNEKTVYNFRSFVDTRENWIRFRAGSGSAVENHWGDANKGDQYKVRYEEGTKHLEWYENDTQKMTWTDGKLQLDDYALDETNTAILSAATINIGAAKANFISITSTNTITGADNVQAGVERVLVFEDTLTLTHNATSFQLPTGANIITAAGDSAIFRSLGSGNWKCVMYQKADGTALAGGAADNLGNHVATQLLDMDGNFLQLRETNQYFLGLTDAIQYNSPLSGDTHSFRIGNVEQFTIELDDVTLHDGAELILEDEDTSTVTIGVPSNVTSNYNLTLPALGPATNDRVIVYNSAGQGNWQDFTGGGGPEDNDLVTKTLGIAEDNMVIGNGTNVAAYVPMPNGVMHYNTATDILSAAASTDLSDITATTGGNTTLVLSSNPTLIGATLTGTLDIQGNLLQFSVTNQDIVGGASGITYDTPVGDVHQFAINGGNRLEIANTSATFQAGTDIILNDDNNSNSITIRAPADVTSTYVLEQPDTGPGTNDRVIVYNSAGVGTWQNYGGTGSEVNDLRSIGDGVLGILDNQFVVGSGNDVAEYKTVPTGIMYFDQATNNITAAQLDQLTDVSGVQGSGSTVVLATGPTITTTTLAGTTTFTGTAILGSNILQFSEAGQDIVGNSLGIMFDIPTGDAFAFEVNSSPVFSIGAGAIRTESGVDLIMEDDAGTETFTLKPPADITGTYELTVPPSGPGTNDRIIVYNSAGVGAWADKPGGGSETNTLTDVTTGIADNQLILGSDVDDVQYVAVPTGALAFDGANAITHATISDLNGITGVTGTSSVVMTNTNPVVNSNLTFNNGANAVFEEDTGGQTVTVSAPTDVTTSYAFSYPQSGPAANNKVMVFDTDGTSTFEDLPTPTGEVNDLEDLWTNVLDDEIAIGVSGNGQALYTALPNGAVSYATGSNTLSQASASDLSDVTGTEGTGSTLTFNAGATVTDYTLNGTTTLGGSIVSSASRSMQLNAASTTELTIENTNGSNVTDLSVDGILKFSNATSFDMSLAGTPTANRTITFQDSSYTVRDWSVDQGGPLIDANNLPPGGAEQNNMETASDGIGIDEVFVGDSADNGTYRALVNGVLNFNTTTNLFSAATITDLSGVAAISGTGDTVVFDTNPILTTTTLGGTTTFNGNLVTTASRSFNLDSGSTSVLTVANTTGGQQANIDLDGQLIWRNNHATGTFTFAGVPTASRTLTFSDASYTIYDWTVDNAGNDIHNDNVQGGADDTAIHDNVASEISAIAAKVTPTSADFLLIEDAADSNNKKRITIGDLPSGGGVDGLQDVLTEDPNLTTDNTIGGSAHLTLDQVAMNWDESVQNWASSINLATIDANIIEIGGASATITDLGSVQAGAVRILRFTSSGTVTDNSSIILPGGQPLDMNNGDSMIIVSQGGGIWECVSVQMAGPDPTGPFKVHDLGTTSGVITLNFDDGNGRYKKVALNGNATIDISGTYDGPGWIEIDDNSDAHSVTWGIGFPAGFSDNPDPDYPLQVYVTQ